MYLILESWHQELETDVAGKASLTFRFFSQGNIKH